jgi:succinate dehydrogenase / fumarate reductase flavoprotein subunit/fumarate reductase flavoprotein subunit
VEENFAGMRERCLRIGVDLARERIEVSPTAHFNMGGVRINRDGFTNLTGLFAAGEDAAGVHGANRLGGNGVAESTVFGARIGDTVARWAAHADRTVPDRDDIDRAEADAERYLNRGSGENPFLLREELGRVMWDSVGIIRNGDKLRKAIEEIAVLTARSANISARGGRAFNLGWQQALDLRNLLLASHLIARSALMREDSRGAHYREDFSRTDDANWLKNIYMAREGAGVKTWTEAVKLDRVRP